MHHLSASLLVALIGGVVDLDSTAAWQFMISQPIVAAPLTGLFLGNIYGEALPALKLGLLVGIILQLLWIEKLPLGMNVPPDAALASVLSVALGFISGQHYVNYAEKEVCYTLALLSSIALGLLGRGLDIFVRRINTELDAWVTVKIEEGSFWAISFGQTLGAFFTFAKAFMFCFVVVWFGVDIIRHFAEALAFKHAGGFIIMQGLLPAVGFSVLASSSLKSKKETAVFITLMLVYTLLPAKLWLVFLPVTILFIYYYYKWKKERSG
ncbi:MAG: PTS sugar transporter subunit IIC [Candidatus Riflebacteria bacterium]|nr:PTS sugar transporter subunit IIC [Candidatus Riflebacteria bacterium]